MGIQKLTGSQALLGGIAGDVVIRSGVTFTGNPTFIGLPEVNTSSSDATLGGLKLGNNVTMYWKEIAIATLVPAGGETDSAWDLPDSSVVLDVFIKVDTPESTGTTKTLDVGLLSTESDGVANGFLDGVSIATAGVVAGAATVTDGTAQNYVSAKTYGAFLVDSEVGGNAAGTAGVIMKKNYTVDSGTARSVSYTAGSSDNADFAGSIYINYIVFA